MPAPIREAILAPEETRFRIHAEPAVNALQSLVMLTWVEEHSGLADWVIRTAENLPQEVLKRNAVVTFGLHYALSPDRSWSSFPAYIDHLAALDPIELRNKVLNAYLDMPCKEDNEKPSIEQILESEDDFLTFLRCRFDDELVIEEIERESYKLLNQPAQMQKTIVDHLQMMWDEVLKDEWARVLPLIDESVQAFEQVDLENMTDEEALQVVTGQKGEKWEKLFGVVDSVVFIPSAHMGPYLGVFHSDKIAWIIFGARQPQGVQRGISDLSRAELLVWLSALSDDTRLRILGMIRERGELCAQEIIDLLDLSQSTCSRHLRQLTASGYLQERRTESGKCYSLSPDRFLETAQSIERYAR